MRTVQMGWEKVQLPIHLEAQDVYAILYKPIEFPIEDEQSLVLTSQTLPLFTKVCPGRHCCSDLNAELYTTFTTDPRLNFQTP
jgi:hypothetical protein